MIDLICIDLWIVTGLSLFSNNAGEPFISHPIKRTIVDFSDPLNPVFNLTCISHNGPATIVTWKRDGSIIPYDDNHMLSQTVTNMLHITYENVLTVKESEAGKYQCCVSNARGRHCSQVYILEEGKPSLIFNPLPYSRKCSCGIYICISL